MFTTSLNNGGHGVLVESYQNGADWYRIYSDGWCEQGGQIEYETNNINLLKEMRGANYTFTLTQSEGDIGTVWLTGDRYTTYIYVRKDRYNRNSTYIIWEVKGYMK